MCAIYIRGIAPQEIFLIFLWVRPNLSFGKTEAVKWAQGRSRFVYFLPTKLINSDGGLVPFRHGIKNTKYDVFIKPSSDGGDVKYAGVYEWDDAYSMDWATFSEHFNEVGVTSRTRVMKFLTK